MSLDAPTNAPATSPTTPDEALVAAEQAIGYRFQDRRLLEQALRHASIADGNHNERLEFLGDAVLGLVVCDLLFRTFPNLREGDMTKIKSHAVSRETCGLLARRLGIERCLILGKGMQGAGNLPNSIGAAALESIIGAIYLDGGYPAASGFVTPLLTNVLQKAAVSGHQHNFKSVLQQYAQQHLDATPAYRILDEQGPDHAKCFKIAVDIAHRRFEACWGNTKKKAEQDAALAALRELGVVRMSEQGDIVVSFESTNPGEGDSAAR